MTPFGRDARLANHPLRARHPLPADTPVAEMWNRIGGLLTRAGKLAGLDRAAMLAVWMAECGGLPFIRGKPVLRFEAHVFFARWGERNEAPFDTHFRFGGRNGIEGARWQNHAMRNKDEWQRFHGDQAREYEALQLAASLAGLETACQCASFGGPQIMGFNHALVGYGGAQEMYRAFGRSERWQVLAFFDFCAGKEILDGLRSHDWMRFATTYNGPGNAAAYAEKIAAAHEAASRLLKDHP